MEPSALVRKLFDVIHEDSELLVINKPAGLVCHPTKTDEYSSLISRVRLYLGPVSNPQLVNRLDRETSGVTLLAKTPKSARELRRIWEAREVRKFYRAIAHGDVRESHGMIRARLGPDNASRVAIKDRVREDGAEASTEFWLERVLENAQCPGRKFSLLRILAHTGRKHQIRIHLSHWGHPIVGDKLYGGDEDLYLAFIEGRLSEEQRSRLILPYHALHAESIRFSFREQERHFEAEPEPWFKAFCSSSQTPG